VTGAVAFAVIFTVVLAIMNATLPQHHRAGHALWLFGFDTLRMNPDHPAQQRSLGLQGFGEVMPANGDVYLYEAIGGRLGVIRGTTNKLETFPSLKTDFPLGKIEPSPSFAYAGGRLWLVTGPGRLRSFDPSTRTYGPTVALPAAHPGPTRVVPRGDGVVAVYGNGAQTVAAVVSRDGRVGTTSVVPSTAPASVLTVSSDGPARTLWVVTRTTAVPIDTTALRPGARLDLTSLAPGGAGAAVGAGGSLWVVANESPEVDRIDATTRRVVKRVRFENGPLHFRQPTDIVATTTDVWLLAPTSAVADVHDARVLRITLAGTKVRIALNTSSALFVGAIALT
jgi:hypothetical protein